MSCLGVVTKIVWVAMNVKMEYECLSVAYQCALSARFEMNVILFGVSDLSLAICVQSCQRNEPILAFVLECQLLRNIFTILEDFKGGAVRSTHMNVLANTHLPPVNHSSVLIHASHTAHQPCHVTYVTMSTPIFNLLVFIINKILIIVNA